MRTELEDFDTLDRMCMDYRKREASKLLCQLNVKELRVLLVHYRLAHDVRDAMEWPKSEMVEEIALHQAMEDE